MVMALSVFEAITVGDSAILSNLWHVRLQLRSFLHSFSNSQRVAARGTSHSKEGNVNKDPPSRAPPVLIHVGRQAVIVAFEPKAARRRPALVDARQRGAEPKTIKLLYFR